MNTRLCCVVRLAATSPDWSLETSFSCSRRYAVLVVLERERARMRESKRERERENEITSRGVFARAYIRLGACTTYLQGFC